jgi:hypothetical protein
VCEDGRRSENLRQHLTATLAPALLTLALLGRLLRALGLLAEPEPRLFARALGVQGVQRSMTSSSKAFT